MHIRLICLCCALLTVGCANTVNAPAPGGAEYRLYFLGGQSNMDGYGFTSELPASAPGVVGRVFIYTGKSVADGESGGGVGRWAALQPGFGTGFDTDGISNRLSDRFGPELAFGAALAAADPEARIAVVKYSRGGTALQEGASGYGTWAPDQAGVNQYDNALATIAGALAEPDVDGDGTPDLLVPAGIVWMQGEADAYHSQASADAYRSNLRRMMDLLRAALRVDDLPVVIGRITDSGMADDGTVMDYIGTVQEAQRVYVEQDACARLVTATDDLGYLEDAWHYDTAGFLRLGEAFAEAALGLAGACGGR